MRGTANVRRPVKVDLLDVVAAIIQGEKKNSFKLKALLCPFHNQSLKLGAFKLGSSLHRLTVSGSSFSVGTVRVVGASVSSGSARVMNGLAE